MATTGRGIGFVGGAESAPRSKPSWNAEIRSKPLPWALGSTAETPTVSRSSRKPPRAWSSVSPSVVNGGDAVVDVGDPGAGEAVGLELEDDGGALDPGPGLDGVGVLVGHHDADGERAELLLERGDERRPGPRR